MLLTFLGVALVGALLAQDRPSMSSPVLRSEAESIAFTTKFSSFSSGKSYRIGVGSAEEALQDAQIELSKGGSDLSNEIQSFKQAFASGYFEVEEVAASGFIFEADELQPGDELTLRVVVPRAEAARLKRLFVLVSQDFGKGRWYIMDGAELNESHW